MVVNTANIITTGNLLITSANLSDILKTENSDILNTLGHKVTIFFIIGLFYFFWNLLHDFVCYRHTKYISMQTENYVTIRTYHDHIMGEIMIAALSNAGIKIFRFDEINNVIPTEDNIEIKVHESDVEAALEIIEAQEGI